MTSASIDRIMAELQSAIADADRAIRPQVVVTPLIPSPHLSRLTGCHVSLKCEHLQPTGSFKFRGATNKLRLLPDDLRRRGVATVSSGNHGLGVSLAGKLLGVPVTVYAAASASPVKLDAIRMLGATVVTIDASSLATELEAAERAQRAGMAFVPPYNDLDVIAGQSTIGLELAQQHGDLAAVCVAVGGGGLVSGVGAALQKSHPSTDIVACWPARAAALYHCMHAGEVIDVDEGETISDGTAGGIEPGTITLPIAQHVIDRIVLVEEEDIKLAMKRLAQFERWMVEGAAGVALAGLMHVAPHYQDKHVAVVLCGRNIALENFIAAVQ
jgi:threonine dehydratase